MGKLGTRGGRPARPPQAAGPGSEICHEFCEFLVLAVLNITELRADLCSFRVMLSLVALVFP